MVCILLSFKLFRCRWHFLLPVSLTPLRCGVFTEDGFHSIKLWIWKFMLFLWVWISSLISPLLDMYFCLHPFFCHPAISSQMPQSVLQTLGHIFMWVLPHGCSTCCFRNGACTLTLCAPGAPLMMQFLWKCTEDEGKKSSGVRQAGVGLTTCSLFSGDTARPGCLSVPSKWTCHGRLVLLRKRTRCRHRSPFRE